MSSLLNLRDLLQHELEDLFSAEEQIIEALPKMIANSSDKELKAALSDHLKVTRTQKDRLEKVLDLMKSDSEEEEKKGFFERIFGGSTKCMGTEGLIKEGEKIMKEDIDPKVKDAAIIAAAQKIEHYEISGYGTSRAYARELGLTEVAKLLEETLNEEYKADDLLTAIALRKVNLKAEMANGGGNGKLVQMNRSQKKSAKSAPSKPAESAPSKAASAAPKKKAAKKAAPKKSSKSKTR